MNAVSGSSQPNSMSFLSPASASDPTSIVMSKTLFVCHAHAVFFAWACVRARPNMPTQTDAWAWHTALVSILIMARFIRVMIVPLCPAAEAEEFLLILRERRDHIR